MTVHQLGRSLTENCWSFYFPSKKKMLWFNCGNRDRLSNFNGETCEYDGLGNPTVYRDRSLEWSRVKDLVRYDGAEFAYDAFGLRTSKIHNGNKTKFLWAGDRLLSERRASEFGDAELGCGHEENDVQCAQGCGNADERLIVCPNTCPNAPGTCGSHNIHSNACPIDIVYLHGVSGVTGLVISKKGAPDRTYYYRKNVQGDVTHILDINGNVKAEYAYDAWGNHKIIVNEDNIADINPFRYRSYYFDSETNLYYLRSRYYDPETGRFINADDIGVLNVTQDHINGLNLYAYCLNNPVNMHDENGHIFGWIKKNIINPIGDVFNAAVDVAVGAVNGFCNWVGNNAETILTAAVIIGMVALTIATGGIAGPVAGMIIGGIIGAASGAALDIISQGFANGFGNIDWGSVGMSALLGAVTGAALGGIGAGARVALAGRTVTGVKAATKIGNVRVYKGVEINTGRGYIGISNNVSRRASEHEGRIIITDVLEGSYSRADARAIEQLLINRGGGVTSGKIANMINSIAPHKYTNSIKKIAEGLVEGKKWIKFP